MQFHDKIIFRKEFTICQKRAYCLFTYRLKIMAGNFDRSGLVIFFVTNIFPHRTLEIKNKCTNKVFKFNEKCLNFFHKSLTPLEDVTIEKFSLKNPTYFVV